MRWHGTPHFSVVCFFSFSLLLTAVLLCNLIDHSGIFQCRVDGKKGEERNEAVEKWGEEGENEMR